MRQRLMGWLLLLTLGLGSPAWAGQTMQLSVGTATTALSGGLDSKASNAWTSASSTIDNRIGQTGNGALICRVEANVTFAASPTAGGALTGYFLKTVDGTNFETVPTASVGQQRAPDFVIPVVTGQTATRSSVDVRCPAERFQVVVQLTGTGQTTAASGNTVKIFWITIQGN